MKIDTSTIDNYSEMSAEEKVTALENYEFEDNSSKLDEYKKLIDKANHEAADYKKKLKALEDSAVNQENDSQAKLNELQEQLAELQRKDAISSQTANYLSMKGFTKELAAETAQAQVDGDMETVFANLTKAQENFENDIKKGIMQGTPKPKSEGSSAGGTMTLDKFKKLSLEERANFASEHKEEYKELYGGK